MSCSSNRQWIDSELVRKVDGVSFVHSTVEYVMAKYGVIKDFNPLLKQGLERSEDAAFWVRQKAGDVIVATKLDQPLKQLDSAAVKGFEKIEETGRQIQVQWEMGKDRVRSARMTTAEYQKRVLANVQAVLDTVEDKFEPLMLPQTPEAAKYNGQPAPLVTFKRVLDITYRLNVGSVRFVVHKVKSTFDPSAWNAVLQKSVCPSRVRSRLFIIRREVFYDDDNASSGSNERTDYMENDELLRVDKMLIARGKEVVSGVRTVKDKAAKGPKMLADGATGVLVYTKDILRQLHEAESIKDVSSIGIHETAKGVETIQNWFPVLQNSAWMTSFHDWLVVKEKTL